MQYVLFAEVYDFLMKDVPYEKWVDFILQKTGTVKGQTVLDAACGTGSVTIELLKRGLHVQGMDISEEMLEQASLRLQREGKRAQMICGDISDIHLHRPVNLITCICDGVNYLTQTDKARGFFKSAYDALNEGGALAFDISSEYKLSGMDGELFYEDGEDITYFWQSSYDKDTKLCDMELNFFVKQEEDIYTRFDERHLQRAYRQEEMVKMLKESGFSHIESYDGYTDCAPKAASDRITFIAIK